MIWNKVNKYSGSEQNVGKRYNCRYDGWKLHIPDMLTPYSVHKFMQDCRWFNENSRVWSKHIISWEIFTHHNICIYIVSLYFTPTLIIYLPHFGSLPLTKHGYWFDNGMECFFYNPSMLLLIIPVPNLVPFIIIYVIAPQQTRVLFW